jgi:protease-4
MEETAEKEKISFKKRARPVLGWLLVVVLGVIVGNAIYWSFGDISSSSDSAFTDSGGGGDCNVAGINIHGSLLTYIPEHAEGDTYFDYDVSASEDIVWMIDQAEEDENIQAILVEVDSPGGLPVAGEEIADAIKNTTKPTLAFIRSAGTSAAYWAISSADKIWASKNSDVGSIGVTMSYLNNVEKNKNEGYTLEQLSIGKYKDSGSSDRALTAEEKALFLRDINIIYENFINVVSVNRNIPRDEVKSFADGSTVLGEKAKELRLIDEIGGYNEVEKYLTETLGTKPSICW